MLNPSSGPIANVFHAWQRQTGYRKQNHFFSYVHLAAELSQESLKTRICRIAPNPAFEERAPNVTDFWSLQKRARAFYLPGILLLLITWLSNWQIFLLTIQSVITLKLWTRDSKRPWLVELIYLNFKVIINYILLNAVACFSLTFIIVLYISNFHSNLEM